MNKSENIFSDNANQLVVKIADGIYHIRIPLFDDLKVGPEYLNSYLLQGNRGWTLIDTGWYKPDSLKSLENSLQSLKLSFKDIRTIVLTHSHPDHYGMAGIIRQQVPKVQILCHRLEADLIESRYIKFSEPQQDVTFLLEKHGVPVSDLEPLGAASMPVMQMVTITLPDQVLYGGETLSTGIFDLEVIWTPGHSPGHICLYEAQNRFLFCGDHILPNITPGVGYHVLSGDNPLGEYLLALSKLANLPVKSAHPGHESSFTDLKGRVEAIIHHHQARENEILQCIASNLSNSYQITRHLTWSTRGTKWEDLSPIIRRMAITETIAHLEHMRWEGKISKNSQNNRISYGPV